MSGHFPLISGEGAIKLTPKYDACLLIKVT